MARLMYPVGALAKWDAAPKRKAREIFDFPRFSFSVQYVTLRGVVFWATL